MEHGVLQGKVQEIGRQTRVSVAVPVYNEEAVIPLLLQRTKAVLDSLPGGPHELDLVDDGGSDRTLELLMGAAEQDSSVVRVGLSRTLGPQTALVAGLDYVSGDAVVLMDGDLQDPP